MKNVCSFLQKINIFFRSALFSILMIVTVIPYSFFCVAAFILPLWCRNAMIMAWNRLMLWLLKVICRIDYKIEGLENIPSDRNGLVFSKHQSTWETLLLPTLFPRAAILIKRELLWLPFFGWGLATLEPIAINRNDKSTAMEQLVSKGRKYLEAGRWILLFPEGTRMLPGTIGKYRLGGARLAAETGYPIIPVAHNAGRRWPKRSFIKHPGMVRVVIGPLIETKDKKPEEILKATKAWIEETMKRIDSIDSKDN